MKILFGLCRAKRLVRPGVGARRGETSGSRVCSQLTHPRRATSLWRGTLSSKTPVQ
jgi:hypothetical protein